MSNILVSHNRIVDAVDFDRRLAAIEENTQNVKAYHDELKNSVRESGLTDRPKSQTMNSSSNPKTREKRLRHLQQSLLPETGRRMAWEELLHLYTFHHNFPERFPDPRAAPKFLQEEYRRVDTRLNAPGSAAKEPETGGK
jgi:hypothetical protein